MQIFSKREYDINRNIENLRNKIIMPRIIWKGCSRKPYEAPDEPLPPEAIKVEIPRNHFWMRALFMAAPLYLPVVASLYLKSHIAGYALIDKRWIALGLLGALLLSNVSSK
ncbi:hypothetical protein Bacsa_2590 [Phocaeicola salanitronis DSM 18170]|uniref:Transmembrane protein n=2 Tax=Phocaeicola salanitronis TaxID=376805 RepID=F0QZ79_PHOSB|nr:hypothetical protein Bacsa_2590 [Phocaeicola salanitronis DSM 18170]